MAKEAVATLVAVAVVVVVAAAMGAGGASAGDDCDAGELAPCLPSIVFGSKPSGKCCSSLRDQQGCLCQYARDPRYRKYIGSPKARHALESCGIAIPSCG